MRNQETHPSRLATVRAYLLHLNNAVVIFYELRAKLKTDKKLSGGVYLFDLKPIITYLPAFVNNKLLQNLGERGIKV